MTTASGEGVPLVSGDDEIVNDIGAGRIEVGDAIRDIGDDEWFVVTLLDWHGDTVLVADAAGNERSFDTDTVIERRRD